jgi:ribonuclease HI
MDKTINLYTDGGCSGNQKKENIGGWGAILEYKEHTKTLHGGEINTTNNRMEMMALLESLRCLKEEGLVINVFSDSAYLVNCFKNKWYEKWNKNGWMTSNKKPVENRDLWEQLLKQISKHKKVYFYRIQGHLNVNDSAELNKWYQKFKATNGNHFSKEDFLSIVEKNIQADALANKGIEEKRKDG